MAELDLGKIVGDQGPKGDKGDKGDPGIPGKEIELRSNNNYIQWRYVGDDTWTNLMSFDDITSTIASNITTVTLSAANWVGDAAPYSYTLTLSGVTTTSNQEFIPITPEEGLTTDMLKVLQSANLQDGGQSNGQVTILAYGEKPTIDLPMRVILRGNI